VSYTEYVEMIVLLHQQNPDDTIKIDLALGELDETSAELKATHQEIKDYVLKELVYIESVESSFGSFLLFIR